MKCRRVCFKPPSSCFTPDAGGCEAVVLLVDELEALRLCDLEAMEQDAAAVVMGISRGTLQRVLYSARAKTADALCYGKKILIEGGNYEVSDAICGKKIKCSRCRFLGNNDAVS